MEQVTSADGTTIAYDRLGEGPPLIVVGGATCNRAMTRPLADELARHFTVINHDRRGRGDSSDNQPFAVQREIEDIDALIGVVGGTASVYGHSSGAALVLRAAADGLAMGKVILHEAPYAPDSDEQRLMAREYDEQLRALLADERRGDALELFFTLVGMPQEMIDGARQSPGWGDQEALAHTLAYDSAAMGNVERGGTVPADLLPRVRAPTLVISGGASPDWMVATGDRLAEGLPDARHQVLEGQGHVVDPEVLAPVVAEFAERAAMSAEPQVVPGRRSPTD